MMKSRTLDSQLVFQQWRVLLQDRQQGTLARRDQEGLEWIATELRRDEGQDYPTFLHQCMYIREHFETGPVTRAVKPVIESLHKRLRQWAEAQFNAEYRYEAKMRDENDPSFWIVRDRKTGAIATIHRRVLNNLPTYTRARKWAAGENGLVYCEEFPCQTNTHQGLFPGNRVDGKAPGAQRWTRLLRLLR